MATRKRKEYGNYIVSDPKIGGGDLTFKGTRVLVKDVLYFIAKGMDWDEIVAGYRGTITRAGIAEAIIIASDFLTGAAAKRRAA